MRVNQSTFVIIAIVSTLLTLTPVRAHAASADPCSLLTPAQVSAVLGASVGEGKRVVSRLCDWSVSGEAAGTSRKKVTLTLQDERAFAYAKAPVGNGITKTPVSGIGDDAVYGTTPHVGTVLTVKKGATVFTVRVYGYDETKDVEQIKEKEKTLALQALQRI